MEHYQIKVRFLSSFNEKNGICTIFKSINQEHTDFIETCVIQFEVEKRNINFKCKQGAYPPFEVYRLVCDSITAYFNIRYNRPIKIEINVEDREHKTDSTLSS